MHAERINIAFTLAKYVEILSFKNTDNRYITYDWGEGETKQLSIVQKESPERGINCKMTKEECMPAQHRLLRIRMFQWRKTGKSPE